MENRHVIMHPTYGYVSKDYTYAGSNLQDAELFSDEDLLVILGILSGGLAAQEMVIMSATEAQALSQSELMLTEGIEYLRDLRPAEAISEIQDAIQPQLNKGLDYMENLRPELEKGFEQLKPELEKGAEYIKDNAPEWRSRIEEGADYIQDNAPEWRSRIEEGAEYIKDNAPEWRSNIEEGVNYIKDNAPEWKSNIEDSFQYMQEKLPEWQSNIEQGIEHLPDMITDLQSQMDSHLQQIQDLTSGEYIDDFVDGLHELNQNNAMNTINQQGEFFR